MPWSGTGLADDFLVTDPPTDEAKPGDNWPPPVQLESILFTATAKAAKQEVAANGGSYVIMFGDCTVNINAEWIQICCCEIADVRPVRQLLYFPLNKTLFGLNAKQMMISPTFED